MSDPSAARTLASAFALFGAQPDADGQIAIGPDELESAFRRRAFASHPDRAFLLGREPEELTRELQRLVQARETLREHLRRNSTDHVRTTRAGAGRNAPPPSPVRSGPSRRSRSGPTRLVVSPWPLRFGEYLRVAGRITMAELVTALIWQRSRRPIIGQLARDLGYLGPQAIALSLKHRRPGERLGESAARLGLLSPGARDLLIERQRRSQPPLGQFFLTQGLLSPAELEGFVLQQRAHNRRCAATR